jgi:hypothetical protein
MGYCHHRGMGNKPAIPQKFFLPPEVCSGNLRFEQMGDYSRGSRDLGITGENGSRIISEMLYFFRKTLRSDSVVPPQIP